MSASAATAPTPSAPPSVAEEQDQLILLAETLGDVRERLQKIEAEFTAQAAPIDAAGRVLEAALAGIKTLQSHILAQDIAQLAQKLDASRGELSAKVDTEQQTRATLLAEVRRDFDAKLGALSAQLGAERTRLASLRRDDRLDLAECHGRLQALDSALAGVHESVAAVRTQLAVAPTAFNPRGDWSDRDTYARLDVVTLTGSSWVSLTDNNKEKPKRGSTAWMLLAARGGGGGGGANAFTSTELVAAGGLVRVSVPAAVDSSGSPNQVAWDDDYFYAYRTTAARWGRVVLMEW